MDSSNIEIGTRKLQKVGGAVQITIPKIAVTMLRLKPGHTMKCWLNGDQIILKREPEPQW